MDASAEERNPTVLTCLFELALHRPFESGRKI